MMMQARFAVYFMEQQRKYGTALYKRAVVQNKSIYMFKAQMERRETMLTSIATQSHAWTLYHSYCSLEHSVTFGACAECQLPLREPESLSPSLSLSPGPFKCDEFAESPDSCALSETVSHPRADHKSLVVP